MKNNILEVITVGLLLAGASVHAQISLPPGGEKVFTSFNDGGIACRVGSADRRCTFLRGFGGTGVKSKNKIRVRSATVPGLGNNGIPRHATARLIRRIVIDDTPDPFDTLVPVAISAIFDYKNTFEAAAAYIAQSSVTLHVRDDITGRMVASHTMFETNRDGDQGIELGIAVGAQRLVLVDASSNLSVMLRRGRVYSLIFELEVMSEGVFVGLVENDATAVLKALTVRVDEDEVEALENHDNDVKELLQMLLDDHAEIIRLLLTPHGQRQSDFISCDGNGNGSGCAFPAPSG